MTGIIRTVAVPQRRRRSIETGELVAAVAVCGGTVLASGLFAQRYSPAPVNPGIRRYWNRLEKPPFEPPDWAFGIWGPLYLMLTISGVRVWTAPRGPARTRALAHWFGIQALDALWVYLGFGARRRGAMTAEAAVTVANAAAYVEAARHVDRPAAWLGVPHLAWIGFAALLSEELWRRNR